MAFEKDGSETREKRKWVKWENCIRIRTSICTKEKKKKKKKKKKK